MGRVFRALDTMLGRPVAVKILSSEQASDGEVLLRFRNEAQSAARLNHANVAQIYHIGEEAGVPFIVFEFIEGFNIRALVEKKGVLPLPEALSYTFQIAEALAHASARNVVHRDIKPSNVLITAQGQAKLIDMGLARLQRTPDASGDLTASGVTLGTFDYISPEQARDPRTADVRSDIYSLGCTLFFMLAGRPPFPQGTVLQKLLQHQGEEPPDVCQFRPDVPTEVSRLLRKMMAKDPRRRFQQPQQLIDTMTVLAYRLGLNPPGPGETNWATDRGSKISLLQRHLPWVAPLALLVMVVLFLDMFWSPPLPRTDVSAHWGGSTDTTKGISPSAGVLPPTEESLSVAATTPSSPPGSPASKTSPAIGAKPSEASPGDRGSSPQANTINPQSPSSASVDRQAEANSPVPLDPPAGTAHKRRASSDCIRSDGFSGAAFRGRRRSWSRHRVGAGRDAGEAGSPGPDAFGRLRVGRQFRRERLGRARRRSGWVRPQSVFDAPRRLCRSRNGRGHRTPFQRPQ